MACRLLVSSFLCFVVQVQPGKLGAPPTDKDTLLPLDRKFQPTTFQDTDPTEPPGPGAPTGSPPQDEGLVCLGSSINPLNWVFCDGLNLCDCVGDANNDNEDGFGNDGNLVNEIVDVINPYLEVSPVTEVPCATEVTEFTSSGVITFKGRPDEVGQEELNRLELVIKEIYNLLIFIRCDGFHRSIESFTISNNFAIIQSEAGEGTGRNLQDEEEEDFSTTYAVVGGCRNCPVTDSGEFSLYDNDSFRRQLSHRTIGNVSLELASLFDDQQRDLQEDDAGECYCLARPDQPQEPNAPRPDEVVSYARTATDTLDFLRILRQNAAIENITETHPSDT